MSGKVQTIPLGFEVGSGSPIAVPLKHLCITGQTQESGKTTTLEALITRSGLRAIAFITKRGEGSFDTGTAILPYFQERADWEFVESVMEATMNEKKKFERSWTIKACRGAHTLADVQRNCQELGAKARRSVPSGPVSLAASTPIAAPSLTPATLHVVDPEVFKGPLPQDFEKFYVLLKQRFMQDAPALLVQLTHTVPEIEVALKREKLEYDTTTAIGKVAYLISKGSLSTGKFPAELGQELTDLGLPTGNSNISEALGRLLDKGFVKKQTNGRYKAIDGMRVNLIEK